MFDSSCFSSVPRHAVGLTFRIKSPVAWLILLVKRLSSCTANFPLEPQAPLPGTECSVVSLVTCSPPQSCQTPLWAQLICERCLVALCIHKPPWCLCVPCQEELCAGAWVPSLQNTGICATGGSTIWFSSACQGEGAICQAKQDLVVYGFVRMGRAFRREASSPCYLR